MSRADVATHFQKLKVLLIREGLILSERVAERFGELRGFVTGLDESQVEVIKSHKIVTDDLCQAHWHALKIILDQHEFRLIQSLFRRENLDNAESMETEEASDSSNSGSEVAGFSVDLETKKLSQEAGKESRSKNELKDFDTCKTHNVDVEEQKFFKKTIHDIVASQNQKCILANSCASDVLGVEAMDYVQFSESEADTVSASGSEPNGVEAGVHTNVSDPALVKPIEKFAAVCFESLKTIILTHYKVLADLMMIQTRTLKSLVQPENNTMSLIVSSGSYTKNVYLRDHFVFLQCFYCENTTTACSLMDEHDKMLRCKVDTTFNSRVKFLENYSAALLASVLSHRQRLDRLMSESGRLLIELCEKHCRTLREIMPEEEGSTEPEVVSSDDDTV